MTDTLDDIDDLQVTYRGQLYRRIAIEPYIRDDGSETRTPLGKLSVPSVARPSRSNRRDCTGCANRTAVAQSIGGRGRQCAGVSDG
jgi:hypothetical protein